MHAFVCVLALLFCVCAHADDDGLTSEQRTALRELDAKIKKLKTEGKLPDALPSATAVSTSTSTSTVSTLATVPSGCTRLTAGQSAVVDYADAASPTGVGAHYGLSRANESAFVVEVNLEFTRGEGFEGDLTPSAINNRYKDRVTACLKDFAGAFKNERAGRSLTLRLAANAAIPVSRISVVGKGKRPNSVSYPSDIGCSTILHELMHLLGLADEYFDTPGPQDPMNDCRPAGPEDSLMSHEEYAVSSLIPGVAFAVEMCKCAVKGDACWELAQKNKGDKCPATTTSILKDIPPDTKTSLNVFNTSEAFALNENRIPNRMAAAAVHTSVIYPAHFRAITEPGCRDVNDTYYRCVLNSYRSSKGVTPQGCLPKPEACKWNSHKWLD
jgi:hypothetical protein